MIVIFPIIQIGNITLSRRKKTWQKDYDKSQFMEKVASENPPPHRILQQAWWSLESKFWLSAVTQRLTAHAFSLAACIRRPYWTLSVTTKRKSAWQTWRKSATRESAASNRAVLSRVSVAPVAVSSLLSVCLSSWAHTPRIWITCSMTFWATLCAVALLCLSVREKRRKSTS